MNRNKMAMALGVALVISGLFTAFLAKQISSKKKGLPSQQYYVALNKAIEEGAVIKAEDVKLISWPANMALNGGFAKTQDVIGRTALSSLAADAPVLNQNLAAPGAGVGLSVRIPDGMRAISLKSDEVVGVSGFLFPGSRVDVLVTYRLQNSPDPITATVLQNVEVLAAGNKIAPDPSGTPVNVPEVTLLLSPQDAAKAVLASSQGTIHFILRNGADTAHQDNIAVELSMLDPVHATKVAVPRVTKVPAAPIHVKTVSSPEVLTVLGDKTATSSF